MRKAGTNVLLSVSIQLACCACSFALDSSRIATQHVLAAWTVRDGFSLGNLYAPAQTPDGHLWLRRRIQGCFASMAFGVLLWQAPAGQDLPGKNIDGLTHQGRASGRAVKTMADLRVPPLSKYPRSGRPCRGEGPQFYPSHHQRWPISRLCYCHFAGSPGLHVVCHPRRPQSV